MTSSNRTEDNIPLGRIFLHTENPRHEPLTSQDQIIEQLCKKENVYELAKDIVKHGLSPLERFAVFEEQASTVASSSRPSKGKRKPKPVYVVAEGNRRVCALKLLTDPDLAPPERRASFEELAANAPAIGPLPCVIFTDEDDLNLWLERTHQGPQGGVGRKDWNAEQKQRHSGGQKNRIALALLDYAENEGIIQRADREGRLTTIQRYVGNPLVREALGVDLSDPDGICRNRPAQDFDILVRKFFKDLLADEQKVTSRSKKPDIDDYARELSSLEGQSREKVDPQPLIQDDKANKKSTSTRPKQPRHPQRLPYDKDTAARLKSLGSWKLENLYLSLCRVSLQQNVPLLAVGTWCFLESLTARAGRQSGDFVAFLNAGYLQQLGLGDKTQTKAVREALQRVSQYGNTTKQHESAAYFNGDQLANDFETLRGVIIACADEAIRTKKNK